MQAAQERPGAKLIGERCESGNDAAFGLWLQETEPLPCHRLGRPRLHVGTEPLAPRLDARPQRPFFFEDVGRIAHAGPSRARLACLAQEEEGMQSRKSRTSVDPAG